MTWHWSGPRSPKMVPDAPAPQQTPASTPGTLAILFVVLLAFLLLVLWYTK